MLPYIQAFPIIIRTVIFVLSIEGSFLKKKCLQPVKGKCIIERTTDAYIK